MPRYFLHIHHGTFIAEDDEGLYFDNLAAARAEAIRGIRSILSEDLSSGRFSLAGRIVIMDEANRIALTVPFREAVEIADEA